MNRLLFEKTGKAIYISHLDTMALFPRVFVVLGGMGNIRGSIIAATVLTILPEALRAMNDYRMLIYAIVLILVMLVTNNPTLKSGWDLVKSKVMFWKKAPAAAEEGGGANE